MFINFLLSNETDVVADDDADDDEAALGEATCVSPAAPGSTPVSKIATTTLRPLPASPYFCHWRSTPVVSFAISHDQMFFSTDEEEEEDDDIFFFL
jgi:hypothetical protein